MRTSILVAALALLPTVAGCSCDGNPGMHNGGDDDLSVPATDDGGIVVGDMYVQCLDGLTSITLSPSNGMVTLDGTNAPAQSFTATGTFSDGHMETLDPSKLAWTATRADDTPPGTIGGGTLTPNGKAGGTVTITATDGCVSGTTTIVFRLDVTVGTPTNPTEWTTTPSTSGTLPTVVYPSNDTRFPRNIYRTLFQWRTGGYSEFRLTFEGPNSKVTIYSNGAHALCTGKNPAAGCFEADETTWSYIAASNAGQTVTWTLDALDRSTPTPTIRRAAGITLGFSRRDVAGAIFYWSTTVAGVRRANIRDAVPENYIAGNPQTTYTNPTDAVKCVACHVVSRDGKYLAAPVQATSGQSLWITQVTTTAPPTPLVKSVANTGGHGFATISPDDQHVAVAWGGPMWTIDRATGVKEADIPLGALNATHPDWSPDNTQLVFATGKGDAPGGASIAVIPYLNPGWGTASTLVAAGGKTNLFPMFSPDGNWIAYSRGDKGGHGDLSARLWIVGKAGANPVELTNANVIVSNKTSDGKNASTQPTWAPPGDLYWVAFNSVREYGVVLPKGTQQIWVAAVDPAKLGQAGVDPSYPAFRLQFQGLNENNHRAFWTLDVRDPTDGGTPPPPDMTAPGDMARMCIPADNTTMCDPVLDRCCDSGYVCDTTDNGLTYTCVTQIN